MKKEKKEDKKEKKDEIPQKSKKDMDKEGGPCGLPVKCSII